MKVVIAPDSFKGSLNAIAVARAMEKGILQVDPTIQTRLIPMADGGEGTVDAVVTALGGSIVPVRVSGPSGIPVESFYGVLPDSKTAVIELAAASGLNLLSVAERNPLWTTSYGFGELIKKALDDGARKLILGIGGSATNDGGVGMARALGVKFLDRNAGEIAPGGGNLSELDRIDASGLDDRLTRTDIVVACDVTNPLCGPQGASAVYGPQKGATPEMVTRLDRNLCHYGECLARSTGHAVKDIPGAGAAGGVGAALMAFLGAKLLPGAQIIMDIAELDRVLDGANFVLTGEGRTDKQTQFGKVPMAIASKAVNHHIPVVCLSGAITEDAASLYAYGFSGIFSIVEGPISLDEAMQETAPLLERAAERILRLFLAGIKR
ncbi:glycerate kinase [Dehalobacter sp. DCM]|uniref:glycerate kinase n=1 Tax=Dehalobacter sp. DCM TaxID=2907827 RepID=UPI003081DB3B|nr:glycerate kinase [Dehalobacter sp. DCM]